MTRRLLRGAPCAVGFGRRGASCAIGLGGRVCGRLRIRRGLRRGFGRLNGRLAGRRRCRDGRAHSCLVARPPLGGRGCLGRHPLGGRPILGRRLGLCRRPRGFRPLATLPLEAQPVHDLGELLQGAAGDREHVWRRLEPCLCIHRPDHVGEPLEHVDPHGPGPAELVARLVPVALGHALGFRHRHMSRWRRRWDLVEPLGQRPEEQSQLSGLGL